MGMLHIGSASGNSVLHEVREVRVDKKVEVVRGRSYAEVLGLSSQPEVECFNSYSEPIARVPSWLKEASIEMVYQAQEVGKRAMAPKFTHAPAKISGDHLMVPTKSHSLLRLVRGSKETRGCVPKNGGVTREVPANSIQSPMEHSSGTRSILNLWPRQLKGREGNVNHTGQSAINVNMELCKFRETLRKLKGEVDIGLARLDWVINNLEGIGSGQGCRGSLVQKVVGPKGKVVQIQEKDGL
jgi:hypothetical protein